jgi:hypothetical protein
MRSVSNRQDAESAANALACCRRLLVIGCPGAGKSKLADELARCLELPLIHLDDVYWRADGTPMPRGHWDRRVTELLAPAAWILDGNYIRTLSPRLRRADGVVFLDYPRRTCLRGAFIRNWKSRRRERWPWWDLPLLARIWSFARTDRPRVVECLNEAPVGCTVLRLASRGEGAVLLGQLKSQR